MVLLLKQKDEEDTRRDGVIPTSLENIPDDVTMLTELSTSIDEQDIEKSTFNSEEKATESKS